MEHLDWHVVGEVVFALVAVVLIFGERYRAKHYRQIAEGTLALWRAGVEARDVLIEGLNAENAALKEALREQGRSQG